MRQPPRLSANNLSRSTYLTINLSQATKSCLIQNLSDSKISNPSNSTDSLNLAQVFSLTGVNQANRSWRRDSTQKESYETNLNALKGSAYANQQVQIKWSKTWP